METNMNEHTELPPRTHNAPPEPILMPTLPGEATAEQIARAQAAAEAPKEIDGTIAYDPAKHAELAAHVDVFCDAAGKWLDIKTVQSAEQSERLTDFVTGARILYTRVETARKAAKKPWDDLGQQVQDAFAPLGAKLDKLGKSMKAMQADWLAREEARKAEEKRQAAVKAAEARAEAERLAAIAAQNNDISGQVEAEALLKAADKAVKQAAKPVKAQAGSATGGGRTMALRKSKHVRIDNVKLAFAYFASAPEVAEVLEQLGTRAARAGTLTEADAKTFGMEIYEKESAA
jgi:hypothetical protein